MNNMNYDPARDKLTTLVIPPGARTGLEKDLQQTGARTADATMETTDAAAWLGDNFARERLLAATPALLKTPKERVVFAGGACAIDPLRSAALSRGLLYDADTGIAREPADFEAVCRNLLGPVTLAQAMDVVGQTDGRTIAVAETKLWSDKVCTDLECETFSNYGKIIKRRIPTNESDRALVQAIVGNLNQRIIGAANGIRRVLYPNASPIVTVEDSVVLPELTERTYDLYRQLGLEIDETDSSIPVLGMYTAAWRETLRSQKLLGDDDLLVVYEPSRHMVVAKSNERKTSMVRTMLAREPYMGPGFNKQVGVLAFAEALLPNGLAFSANVPAALQPNSTNMGRFDFSRYPLMVEQKGKGDVGSQTFRFLEKINNLDVTKNPAFLWAVTAFPPTPELLTAVREMIDIAKNSNAYIDQRRKTGEWQPLPEVEKNALSIFIRERASREMEEAARKTIAILEGVCAAVFDNTQVKEAV